LRHQVQFSDSSWGENLAEFLRGLRFDVAFMHEQTLDVRFREPMPANEEAARLELDLYLRVWQAINPEAHARRFE
jgi:hypothetical protein